MTLRENGTATPAQTPLPSGGASDRSVNTVRLEIVIGDVTRAHAARALEQVLQAAWHAAIEAAGQTPTDGWALVIDRMRLVREEKPPAWANGPTP